MGLFLFLELLYQLHLIYVRFLFTCCQIHNVQGVEQSRTIHEDHHLVKSTHHLLIQYLLFLSGREKVKSNNNLSFELPLSLLASKIHFTNAHILNQFMYLCSSFYYHSLFYYYLGKIHFEVL